MIKNLKSHVTGGKKVTSSENSAKTLGDIIKKKKFVIPMYQRNYKWNTSVVIKLVDDILDCYNRSKRE